MGDGEALADVDAEIVGPREGGHELEGVGGEATHDALGAPDEDELLADREAVGTARKEGGLEN